MSNLRQMHQEKFVCSVHRPAKTTNVLSSIAPFAELLKKKTDYWNYTTVKPGGTIYFTFLTIFSECNALVYLPHRKKVHATI